MQCSYRLVGMNTVPKRGELLRMREVEGVTTPPQQTPHREPPEGRRGHGHHKLLATTGEGKDAVRYGRYRSTPVPCCAASSPQHGRQGRGAGRSPTTPTPERSRVTACVVVGTTGSRRRGWTHRSHSEPRLSGAGGRGIGSESGVRCRSDRLSFPRRAKGESVGRRR